MSIFNNCQPRLEVRQGELNDAIFAADFGDLIAGRSADVYGDPEKFFANTHPCENLRNVAAAVFRRLQKPEDTGLTLRLSTGFGGGKTHTLMTLWHLGQSASKPKIGAEVLAASERPPKVTTIAVDCGKAGFPEFNTHSDASTHSLWGELFYQLGESAGADGGKKALELLGKADDPEASPNAKQLESVLPTGPLLFLIDELVIYMAKLSERGQGNLLGFLNLLASVVSNRPQTVLVVTDPGQQAVYAQQSQRIAQQLADCAHDLEDIFGRKMASIDPIGDESSKVIVRRLFGKVDASAAKSAAEAYSALFKRVTETDQRLLPSGAHPPTSPAYRKLIEDCYPFHPRLLKTAEERLGAMASFQKSRGVLRLFARIIRDVWNNKTDCDLISAGDVNWADKDIQADLLNRLQQDKFITAVRADVAGHAADLDGGKRGVHVRAASALLLESLDSANATSGMDAAELTLAILRLEDAGPEPGEALDRLIGVCWHTYPLAGGRGWQFRTQPNVLRQIDDMRSRISADDATARIRAQVQEYFSGSVFKLAAWASQANQVPEAAELQLALCSGVKQALNIVTYSDDRDATSPVPRGFRNAIVAVAPSEDKWTAALEKAQRLMAAEKIRKEHATGEHGKQVLEQLDRLEPDLKKQFFLHSFRAFDQVVLSGRPAYHLEEQYMVPEAQVLQRPNGQSLLRKFLQDKSLLFEATDGIDPDFFVEKVLPGSAPVPGESEVFTTKAIHERILSAAGLRLIPDPDVIRSTLRKAVDAGKITIQFSDDACYDSKGAVDGIKGHRRRTATRLPLAIPLDGTVRVTLIDTPTAAVWLHEDAAGGGEGGGGGEEGGGPPPPPPLSKVTATSWPTILEYSETRPMLQLELRAPAPALAGTLATLAQPLGADLIAVSVTVSGDAKDGGSVNFAANDLKINHPTKPLQMAQTLFNSLTDGCSYEATVQLTFKGGRPGLKAALENLQQSAAAEVMPVAVFDKPLSK